MRISDWSSDVCSSDLVVAVGIEVNAARVTVGRQTRFSAGAGTEATVVADHPCCEIHRLFHALAGGVHPNAASGDEQHNKNGHAKNGRASGRERVSKYVSISVVAVSLKKKKNQQ